MPARELQQQLDTLREQLEQNPPLTQEERDHLNDLSTQIQAQIDIEKATSDSSLADNVNLAVERFELDHPALAGTLRNIVQTLGNIGIYTSATALNNKAPAHPSRGFVLPLRLSEPCLTTQRQVQQLTVGHGVHRIVIARSGTQIHQH